MPKQTKNPKKAEPSSDSAPNNDTSMEIGQIVKITGLKNSTELNGKYVTIIEELNASTCRYRVRIWEEEKIRAVKPQNLENINEVEVKNIAQYFIDKKKYEELKALIKNSEMVRTEDMQATFLYFAYRYDDIDAFKLLLNNDFNPVSKLGEITIIYLLTCQNKVDYLKAIAEHPKTRIILKNYISETQNLQLAAIGHGHIKAFEFLLEHGANPFNEIEKNNPYSSAFNQTIMYTFEKFFDVICESETHKNAAMKTKVTYTSRTIAVLISQSIKLAIGEGKLTGVSNKNKYTTFIKNKIINFYIHDDIEPRKALEIMGLLNTRSLKIDLAWYEGRLTKICSEYVQDIVYKTEDDSLLGDSLLKDIDPYIQKIAKVKILSIARAHKHKELPKGKKERNGTNRDIMSINAEIKKTKEKITAGASSYPVPEQRKLEEQELIALQKSVQQPDVNSRKKKKKQTKTNMVRAILGEQAREELASDTEPPQSLSLGRYNTEIYNLARRIMLASGFTLDVELDTDEVELDTGGTNDHEPTTDERKGFKDTCAKLGMAISKAKDEEGGIVPYIIQRLNVMCAMFMAVTYNVDVDYYLEEYTRPYINQIKKYVDYESPQSGELDEYREGCNRLNYLGKAMQNLSEEYTDTSENEDIIQLLNTYDKIWKNELIDHKMIDHIREVRAKNYADYIANVKSAEEKIIKFKEDHHIDDNHRHDTKNTDQTCRNSPLDEYDKLKTEIDQATATNRVQAEKNKNIIRLKINASGLLDKQKNVLREFWYLKFKLLKMQTRNPASEHTKKIFRELIEEARKIKHHSTGNGTQHNVHTKSSQDGGTDQCTSAKQDQSVDLREGEWPALPQTEQQQVHQQQTQHHQQQQLQQQRQLQQQQQEMQEKRQRQLEKVQQQQRKQHQMQQQQTQQHHQQLHHQMHPMHHPHQQLHHQMHPMHHPHQQLQHQQQQAQQQQANGQRNGAQQEQGDQPTDISPKDDFFNQALRKALADVSDLPADSEKSTHEDNQYNRKNSPDTQPNEQTQYVFDSKVDQEASTELKSLLNIATVPNTAEGAEKMDTDATQNIAGGAKSTVFETPNSPKTEPEQETPPATPGKNSDGL